MRVRNQKPQSNLSPLYKLPIAGDFEPIKALRQCVIDPIMTPISTASPVEIEISGKTYDDNDITEVISNCLGGSIDPINEAIAKKILGKCVSDYDETATLPVDAMFATCAAFRCQFPEPVPPTYYTPKTDIIPACQSWLSAQIDNDELFCEFAYTKRPDTLGFAFSCKDTYDAFLKKVNEDVTNLSAGLPPDTVRTFNDFCKNTSLNGLTESLWLRKDPNDGCQEFSFARMLIAFLIDYAKNNPTQCVCMPYSMNRLFLPESLVFINIDAHAHATPFEIDSEWKTIQDAIDDDIRVLRPGQIQSLTAIRKNIAKVSAQAVSAADSKNAQANKMAAIKFHKKPPTRTDIAKLVTKVMTKMARVNHSHNTYKQTKLSFARPNRRDPDDYNKQGKVTSTKYLPDIHLYVDTSGSISKSQYEDAVISIIQLVRKLNVSLYFNSFSHVMSTTTFLPTKGRSSAQIWNQIQHIKKVTGWTDYAQIWAYVEASKKRKRELSIVITDFEYYPPTAWKKHPKNLYYMPISTSNWDQIVYNAQNFANAMKHIDPMVRKENTGLTVNTARPRGVPD